jgi:hypothetical protein
MIYLSESAIIIWRLCDGKRTVKEIAELLASSYAESDERMYVDVSDTIEHLKQEGVLELEGV